jgi:hypothetical protein
MRSTAASEREPPTRRDDDEAQASRSSGGRPRARYVVREVDEGSELDDEASPTVAASGSRAAFHALAARVALRAPNGSIGVASVGDVACRARVAFGLARALAEQESGGGALLLETSAGAGTMATALGFRGHVDWPQQIESRALDRTCPWIVSRLAPRLYVLAPDPEAETPPIEIRAIVAALHELCALEIGRVVVALPPPSEDEALLLRLGRSLEGTVVCAEQGTTRRDELATLCAALGPTVLGCAWLTR